MPNRFLILLSALGLVFGSALASEPDHTNQMGNQPPARQSAPADSSHASGHDVQAGQPETGETKQNKTGGEQTKTGRETKDTAPPGPRTTGSNSGQ